MAAPIRTLRSIAAALLRETGPMGARAGRQWRRAVPGPEEFSLVRARQPWGRGETPGPEQFQVLRRKKGALLGPGFSFRSLRGNARDEHMINVSDVGVRLALSAALGGGLGLGAAAIRQGARSMYRRDPLETQQDIYDEHLGEMYNKNEALREAIRRIGENHDSIGDYAQMRRVGPTGRLD